MMALPRDPLARRYYRVAEQRLEEAWLIFHQLQRWRLAEYVAGYAIECVLKSLLAALTPRAARLTDEQVLEWFKKLGHNLLWLAEEAKNRGAVMPHEVQRQLVLVGTWSPEERYIPGMGHRKEAERFLRAVECCL